MNIYNMLWIFFIYSFLGWCSEVIFAAVTEGRFVNRGFNTGPVCPIYGFGILLVVTLLQPFENNLLILFLLSVIVTSVIEFITGYVLEKFFHQKWWDYSDMPYNVKGYICIKFSILWGLACLFVVKIVHPFIVKMIAIVPGTLSKILIFIFIFIFIADFTITLINILKLPKKVKALMEIERALEKISANIGGELSNGAIALKEINENVSDNMNKIKNTEFKDLMAKQKEILSKKNYIHKRIIKAYPNITKGKYKEAFKKITRSKKNDN